MGHHHQPPLRRLAAALALALAACLPAAAQEYAAVLAKGSGLYLEAYLDFQKALGKPVTVYDLSAGKPRFPAGLKAAAAFGHKAAAAVYPEGVRVVVLLAPGYRPGAARKATVISSFPEPAQALAAYRKLQPELRRLAVFHYDSPCYIEKLAGAGAAQGVEIVPVKVASPAGFPDALRALKGRADAFWLLPEPTLITKTSLAVLSEFSCANRLPFYAPSPGTAELGAAASFAPGLQATAAAAAAAFGRPWQGVVHVPESRLTVNEPFARRCGLPLALEPGKGVNR